MLFGAAFNHALADADGSGSPQNSETLSVGMLSGTNIPILFIIAIMEGTESQVVIELLRINRAGPIISSGRIMWSAAPASQVRNIL